MVPDNARAQAEGLDLDARLRLFDAATARQRARESGRPARRAGTRGWTREQLYEHRRTGADSRSPTDRSFALVPDNARAQATKGSTSIAAPSSSSTRRLHAAAGISRIMDGRRAVQTTRGWRQKIDSSTSMAARAALIDTNVLVYR